MKTAQRRLRLPDAWAVKATFVVTLIAFLATAQNIGRLAGVVLNEGGKPLEQHPIQLLNETGKPMFSAITDEKGNFYFYDIPYGRYTVQSVRFPKDKVAVAVNGDTFVVVGGRGSTSSFFRSELKPGGFTPYHPPGAPPQIPGCACGTANAIITSGKGNTYSLEGQRLEPITFRWDAAWICQGQSIKGYPHPIDGYGRIEWDGEHTSTLPDTYGEARVIYGRPGSYRVGLIVTATCWDDRNGGAFCLRGNPCTARAEITINVK